MQLFVVDQVQRKIKYALVLNNVAVPTFKVCSVNYYIFCTIIYAANLLIFVRFLQHDSFVFLNFALAQRSHPVAHNVARFQLIPILEVYLSNVYGSSQMVGVGLQMDDAESEVYT